MLDKPDHCYSSGCPLAKCKCGHALADHNGEDACQFHADCGCLKFQAKGKGFVLGCGDPEKAKYMFVLEAPGRDEVAFPLFPVASRWFMETKAEVDAELAIRKRDYPDIPERLLNVGLPVVGQSGAQLQFWAFPKAGILRKEIYFDNTLRCLPPKKAKTGAAYPTGDDRKLAEKCCRQFDRIRQYGPDTLVFSLHPAGIMREITPLPLQIKDCEKIRDFTEQGRRVIALLGGKAVKAFARFGENVTKWRGNYVVLHRLWPTEYTKQFEFTAKKSKKAKAERAQQLAAMDSLFEIAPMLAPEEKKPTKRRKKNATESEQIQAAMCFEGAAEPAKN